jgi:hypothetical protein
VKTFMKDKFYSIPIIISLLAIMVIAIFISCVAYAGDPKLNRPNEWRDKNTFRSDVVFSDAVEFSDSVDVSGASLTVAAGAIEGAMIEDGAITSARMAIPNIQSVQFTLSHADFTASATSEILEPGVTIPKGAYVLITLIDDVTKFEGASISAATLVIGDSDGAGGATNPDRYNTGTPDVFADADVLDAGVVSGTALHDDDTDIAVTLTLTAGDCDETSAGAATVTIFYLLGFDHS